MNKSLVWRRWGLPLFAALFLIPGADAHAAPKQRDYEARLLHDCIDDYFGGDVATNRDGHDVIALDLREIWDPAFGENAIVFRLLLNGGYGSGASPKPVLKDVLSFSVGGAAKTFQFTTNDNQAFAGSFDRIVVVQSINDGTRFAVEGTAKLSTIGATIGTKISTFKVESFVGNARGDFMPGTYDTNGVTTPSDPNTGCPVGQESGRYLRPDYAVAGPVQYVSAALETKTLRFGAGETVLVGVMVDNLLPTVAQTVTVAVAGANGVKTQFHDPETNRYSDVAEFAAPQAQKGALVHLRLTEGTVGAKGTLTFTVLTDLGGRVQQAATYEVGPAGAPTSNPPSSPSTPSSSKGSTSGAPFLLLVAAVVMAALAGRRE